MNALRKIALLPEMPLVLVLLSRLVYDSGTRAGGYSQVYLDAFYIIVTDVALICWGRQLLARIEDDWPNNLTIRKAVVIAVIILLAFEIAVNLWAIDAEYAYFRQLTRNMYLDFLRATVIFFYLTIEYFRFKWD